MAAAESTKYVHLVVSDNSIDSIIPFAQQFDLDDAMSMPEHNSSVTIADNSVIGHFTQQFDLDDAMSPPPDDLLTRHHSITRLVSDMPMVNHATGNCSICMESLEQSEGPLTASRQVYCGHIYHHNCITDWLLNGNSNSCPLCRHQIFS